MIVLLGPVEYGLDDDVNTIQKILRQLKDIMSHTILQSGSDPMHSNQKGDYDEKAKNYDKVSGNPI